MCITRLAGGSSAEDDDITDLADAVGVLRVRR